MQQMTGEYNDQQAFERMEQASRADGAGRTFPRRFDIFFHLFKTFRLIGALIADRRVSLWRKLFFAILIVGLLLILLFPDALNETFLSAILPFIGTVLGVPLDAGFDWAAFALVVVSLLHVFPAELVAEHYRIIFHG